MLSHFETVALSLGKEMGREPKSFLPFFGFEQWTLENKTESWSEFSEVGIVSLLRFCLANIFYFTNFLPSSGNTPFIGEKN